MANRKTNRKEHSQNALPERPGHNSVLVAAAGSAVQPSRSGQGLSRCGRPQEHRCILPAPDTKRPRTTESANRRGSNGGVVAPRKSDPMNGCATPYRHNDRQMAVPTFRGCGDTVFRWRDSDNPCGTPATITAVHLPTAIRNVLPHEAMPNYNSHAGIYILAASPAMFTRQVLGCRGSEPTGGRPAGSQLAAVEFCKDKRNERSARMAGRHLPEAPNFAEGLTALHGIEAVPEWR